MSLRFGLWLVEQGVMTCDQFCGLVKIQQDNLPAPGAVALRANLMTIRQVDEVNRLIETSVENGSDFLQLAVGKAYITAVNARTVQQIQTLEAPPLDRLAIQYGLLTKAQAEVLLRHFLYGNSIRTSPPAPADNEMENELQPVTKPEGEDFTPHPIPEPKFRQRPVIVHQYDVTY